MAKAIKELEYVATAEFEALIETPAVEFKEQATEDFPAGSNGLPEARILSRDFVVLEDCNAYVGGMTVPLKEKAKVKDVGLAFAAIDQAQPIVVRDRLLIPAGTVLVDVELAEALLELKKPLTKREKQQAEAAPPADPSPPADPPKGDA